MWPISGYILNLPQATELMPTTTTYARDPVQPEAMQVLLEASAMLLATSSESAVLSQILDLAGKLCHADAYAVWRAFDGGTVWRAIATRGLSESYRTEVVGEARPVPAAAFAVEDISDPLVIRDRDHFEAEKIRSLLAVPLNMHGEGTGTLTFYWRTPRSFSQSDKDFAFALGNLAAAALTISELHEQNRNEKARLGFLAEASCVLASSLDYETTLQQVARLAVPHIADWCTVHIVEDGAVNRLVVAHVDPEMLALATDFSKRYPEEIRPDRGLGALLRTGSSEFIARITDEMIAAAARDEDHLKMLRDLRITSSIMVPLTSRGTVLGAIRLLAAGEPTRYFTQDDLQLAEDLARRAGAAIENANLHRAVLQQEHQLRLSHAAARIGHWTLDVAKQKTIWSPEFKAMHHLPPDMEPTWASGAALVYPDDRERVLEKLQAVLDSTDDNLHIENRAVTPDGQLLWLQSRGRIVRDAKGKALVIHGITIDVTESRLAENALRRTEKLAAAGRLAATVAHEVNNPLEALMNLVYLAQHCEGLPEQAAVYLKTASAEINRMAHVVRQTLGFYREQQHPVETDLGLLVAEVIELYRSRAQSRGIQLCLSAEPERKARVNSGEIRQVIANLVANAIDATPEGGTIAVSVVHCDEGVAIAVKDSGTGIADVHREHLFEPFFTTKLDVGTGLGLWVSKEIVDKHAGRIEVASKALAGTTMTVILPRG